MTQSLFDPTSDDMNRGGSSYLPPEGLQNSHMPSDLISAKLHDPDVPVDPKLVFAAEDEHDELL